MARSAIAVPDQRTKTGFAIAAAPDRHPTQKALAGCRDKAQIYEPSIARQN